MIPSKELFDMKYMKQTNKYFNRCNLYLMSNGTTLREYQKTGVKWMIQRELRKQNTLNDTDICKTMNKVRGGLLCDEMGLGKTIQTISVILSRTLPKKKTLIILPCSVLIQWKQEFRKFAPKLNVIVHHGKTKIKTFETERFQSAHVVLTTYNMVYNRQGTNTILHERKWGRVILDECHYIRNSNSKRHIGCCKLKAKCKWGLTGTPIQNYKKDLYSIFKFIGLFKGFVDKNLEILRDTYILRRSKKELETIDSSLKLPEKVVEYVELPFATEYEKNFYKKVREGILRELRAFAGFGNVNITEILEHIMRLRQATIHPQLVIDGYSRKYNKTPVKSEVRISTKMKYIIDTIKDEKRKTIIFCSFLSEMDMFETFLKEEGFKVGRIDGSVAPAKRISIIDTADNIDVMIVQIDAGGTGLNMTKFNRVFITSPSWNPCIELQAIARAHRIGQKNKVKVSKIILVSNTQDFLTIDELIRNKQEYKRDIIETTLNDDTYFDGIQRRNVNKNIRSLLK